MHFKNLFQQFDPQVHKLFHIHRHAAKKQGLQTSSEILRFNPILGNQCPLQAYLAFCKISKVKKVLISTTHFQFSCEETSVVRVSCNCGIWALGDKKQDLGSRRQKSDLAHRIPPTHTVQDCAKKEKKTTTSSTLVK